MFKSSVAWILNKHLGKYVQDLDTENLNVGIFNGEVQLHNLKLKPEALYELKLPIEVREGLLGTVSLSIPWNGFLNQAIVLTIEDVLVVAGAVVGDIFDAELEKRLLRATKKRILDELEDISFFDLGKEDGVFGKLATNLAKNLQIFIRNVHIRYEDTTSMPDSPVSCGLCLQSLSIETTNSKWKPCATPLNANSIYQLIRIQSLSFYWNPCTRPKGLVLTSNNWRQSMYQGLQSFSVNGEPFEFILKPVSAKAKLIITQSNEVKVPKLLLDVVVQDAVMQISRAQYTSMVALQEAFDRIEKNREYREYHPGVNLHKNASLWWQYALAAVLEQRVRPYSWPRIKAHRETYRQYVKLYKENLLKPADIERKLDLQQLEDRLKVIDLVIAREHAKMELSQEIPEKIIVSCSERWWLGLWKCVEPEIRLDLVTEPSPDFWGRLTSQEKEKIYELIEYAEGSSNSKPKQFIEHKYNLTLSTLSMSMLSHGHEIALTTITQLLMSLETRSAEDAFKFSVRAEKFLLEGISSENELVPLIQADMMNSDSSAMNVFAFDFEKNPAAPNIDFSVTMRLEPLEIVYNEQTLSELIGFFQRLTFCKMTEEPVADFMMETKSMIRHFLVQQKKVYLNLILKGPTLVLPEQGSLQRGGQLMILDTGCLKVSTELQSGPISIEDETKTELEEHLYDRLNMELTNMQIMFCDCSDEWREKRKMNDSDLHLLSCLKTQFMFSNSIKQDYKQLPRQKVNFSIGSVKLNLSNRKINQLLNFVDVFPLPTPNSIHSSQTMDSLAWQTDFSDDLVEQILSLERLKDIRTLIVQAHLTTNGPRHICDAGLDLHQKLMLSASDAERLFLSSSDQSDEESEIWAKILDQPGFEDNVSPHNTIEVLLRFMLGELVINFSKSENKVDLPYLMLRLEKICVDSALLQYGPAVQLGLASFQLVDKIHTCAGGCYIELMSGNSTKDVDILTVLYRKIKANCPDFKSHFHSIEHSLVIDLQGLNVLFHREAFVALFKYFSNLSNIIRKHDSAIGSMISASMTSVQETITTASTFSLSSYFAFDEDPPVPPGATKLSYSVRVADFQMRMSTTDTDFLDIKVSGFETDCLVKANERTVHRLFLNNIAVEDLSDMTLYNKIVFLEGEHLIDAKFVVHSSRISAKSGIENSKDKVKTDGTIKATVGRLNVVYLHRIGVDIMNFLEPFVDMKVAFSKLLAVVGKYLSKLRHFPLKMQLALDIFIPTLLIPQKSESPNLLILNLGKLQVENFFKWDDQSTETAMVAIENILAKLECVQVSRAIITLAGTVEPQEPILEPTGFKIDFKRRANTKSKGKNKSYSPMCKISGTNEKIVINLGQNDLATILMINQENAAEGLFAELHPKSAPLSPVPCCGEKFLCNKHNEDKVIQSLQSFLCQNQEDRPEVEVNFAIDSISVNLFMDMDEDLSSPVRCPQHALCKFELQDFISSVVASRCGAYNIKATLQSMSVKDAVKNYNIFERRSYNMQPKDSKDPPFIEWSANKSTEGSWAHDVEIESHTINLTAQFLTNLFNFVYDSINTDLSTEGGIINYGYIGDLTCNKVLHCQYDMRMDPGEVEFSMALRQMDINLMSENANGCINLQAEIILNYSCSPKTQKESCEILVARVQATHKEDQQNCHVVLQSCDLEFSRQLISFEEGVKINISMSPLNINFSSKVAQMIQCLVGDIISVSQPSAISGESRMPLSFQELENLWTPKKIPVCVPYNDDVSIFKHLHQLEVKLKESLLFTITSVNILFTMDGENNARFCMQRPLLQIKSSLCVEILNWSSQVQLLSQIQMQASYFNERLRKWEPLIEHQLDGDLPKPLEIFIQLFHGKAFSLSTSCIETESTSEKKKSESDSNTCTKMTFIGKECTNFDEDVTPKNSRKSSNENGKLEKEDEYLNKLAELIEHLVREDKGSESDDYNSKDELSEVEHSDEADNRVLSKFTAKNVDDEFESAETIATYVVICAKDRLELSLNHNAVETFNTLFTKFLGDPSLDLMSQYGKEIELHNFIGPSSTVSLYGRLRQGNAEGEYVLLEKSEYGYSRSGQSSPDLLEEPSVGLDVEKAASAAVLTPTYKDDSADSWYHRTTSMKLTVEIEGFNQLNVLVPQRRLTTVLPLESPKYDSTYHVAVSVENKLGSKIIMVNSPLRIFNETAHAVSLYYNKSSIEAIGEPVAGEIVNPFQDLAKVAVIEPSETYNVPLFVAYHSKLYILPAYIEHCRISENAIWWKDFRTKPKLDIFCSAKQEDSEVIFSVRAVVKEEQSAPENNIPNYLVRLTPPVKIYNYLPMSVEMMLPITRRKIIIETGAAADTYELDLRSTKISITVSSYRGCLWHGELHLKDEESKEKFVLLSEGSSEKLTISARTEELESKNIYLFASHWIVNKCGTPLSVRALSSKTEILLNNEELALASLERKQDVQIKVGQSSWSTPFSLQATGTSGVPVCQDHERGNKMYRLHTTISYATSCPSLTKIVTILPYFMVVNNCRKHIRFMEDNEKADFWIDLAPATCTPFWPDTTTMKMFVKFREGKILSQSFPINFCHATVLKMDKGCGLSVKVTGGADAPFTIMFSNYKTGDAPLRIDNLSELVHIKIHQKDSSQNAIVLSPYHSLLYTWDDHCSERMLLWNVCNSNSDEIAVDIWKDGHGVQKLEINDLPPPSPSPIPPSSTTSSMSIKISAGLRRLSKPTFDAASKLQEDPCKGNEIFIYWVTFLESGQRVLLLTTDLETALRTKSMIEFEKGAFELNLSLKGLGISIAVDEDEPTKEIAYASLQESAPNWEIMVSQDWNPMPFELAAWCEEKFLMGVPSAQLKTLFHVDFEKMQLIKPFFAEVRRIQNPAVWLQYRKSSRQVYVNWKIQQVQIDNNLMEAESPVLISPKPNMKSAMQPCFDLKALCQHFTQQSVYKYITLNVASIEIDLDFEFCAKILQYAKIWHSQAAIEAKARSDVAQVHQLFGYKQNILNYDCLIEYIYLSPLVVEIRYNPAKKAALTVTNHGSNLITDLFGSLRDAKHSQVYSLRLQPCEKVGLMLPVTEQLNVIGKHYLKQMSTKFHASILGQNVLTNPLGLISDVGISQLSNVGNLVLSTEPCSCGVELGSKILMGYAFGTAASELMPGGEIAEYLAPFARHELQNRRYVISETSENQILLQYCVKGLFYGESKSQNYEKFCKGTGEKVMLMAENKDISSPFSTISYALKRLVDFGETNLPIKVRLTKYTNPYVGFKTYCENEAIGQELLRTVLADATNSTEIYWSHLPLKSENVILISDQKIYVLKQSTQLWGSWSVEKEIKIGKLISVPQVKSSLVVFLIMGDGREEYQLDAGDALVAKWLQNKIETAMIAAMEEKPCPATL
ncbi:intermembrane lipid transfer protein VPS13C-like [Neocloeon triangulifer]|uniref:intermembrane lipid transfer protein VPS13C-like n=1 Tax=Neocloeon triangulifer TaxID=2078957 RepID=UPI00286F5FF0|nr:intermembrane lipid transfer protein VPS13C-like [Neocloeon triangulifer]